MAGENDLIKLYSERILALATQLPPSSRLDNPEASVKKRSPLCGSAVTVDVKTENGRVSEFAQDVKACALRTSLSKRDCPWRHRTRYIRNQRSP